MFSECERIIIEEAKNGEFTCRVLLNGKWVYLYSKYRPRFTVKIDCPNPTRPCVMLGLGLAYELESLREQTDQEIIVIEKHAVFMNFLRSHPELSKLLDDPSITFYTGDVIHLPENFPQKFNLIKNRVCQLDEDYYDCALAKLLPKRKNKRKRVLFFEHITIADDCILTLRESGFEVIKAPKLETEKVVDLINELKPDYLFSINFPTTVFEASQHFNIPSIFWAVDTPCFRLYNKDLRQKYVFLFVYDKFLVNDLRQKGTPNVYHMPVAANSLRLSNTVLSHEDKDKYGTDISFVGSTGYESEYNTSNMDQKFSPETLKYLYQLYEDQLNRTDKFILRDLVDEPLAELLKQESGLYLPVSDEICMSRLEKLTYLLGKKCNELERIAFVRTLASHYSFKVYGDEHWKTIEQKGLQYMGSAEHYHEMPKVFKSSKINLNIIRSYVDSGLPMRIFDVLGCGAFLVSNDRDEISELFTPGKDLVIYRDLKDLVEICDYYLQHDDERQNIASQGFETVKSEHDFRHRLLKIFELVDAEFSLARLSPAK
ncbi:Uncharacterized protein SCG7109_AA_00030 [Chlamydiales bacterium SCGC AG-110-M15]|nr:Uncharacterized protein SCG7109_AA_00030 [Chlamydiales bacterium SCGC AG-110-M15]